MSLLSLIKTSFNRSEQRNIFLSQTFDQMLEGIQIHDFSWRYVYVNNALVKYSHYSKEELLGNTLMAKYPGIEATALFGVLERCMKKRVAAHFETEFIFQMVPKLILNSAYNLCRKGCSSFQ
jgi:PAS domain-containing protein